MVKISISLPNNALITFESEESEVLHEIIALALRDLPRDLMQPSAASIESVSTKKNKDNSDFTLPKISSIEPSASSIPKNPRSKTKPLAITTPPEGIDNQAADHGSIPQEFLSGNGRADFEAFCQKANPLGDMRRAVVAAEGAKRHFGVDSVNATDLGWLFDAAGWRKPSNFTQTLRNAARSKFAWLERIPGRSGRYVATPLGVSKTLQTM